MAQGEILWFDAERGYGFIRPDLGPRDVFCHVSALDGSDPSTLCAGDAVEFELVQNRQGRLTAQGVRRLPRRLARGRQAQRPSAGS